MFWDRCTADAAKQPQIRTSKGNCHEAIKAYELKAEARAQVR